MARAKGVTDRICWQAEVPKAPWGSIDPEARYNEVLRQVREILDVGLCEKRVELSLPPDFVVKDVEEEIPPILYGATELDAVQRQIDAIEEKLMAYRREHPGSPRDLMAVAKLIGRAKEYDDLLRRRFCTEQEMEEEESTERDETRDIEKGAEGDDRSLFVAAAKAIPAKYRRNVRTDRGTALWRHLLRIKTTAVTPEQIDSMYPPSKIEEDIDGLPGMSSQSKEKLKRVMARRNQAYRDYLDSVQMGDASRPTECDRSEESSDWENRELLEQWSYAAMGLFSEGNRKERGREGLDGYIFLCPDRIRESAKRLTVEEDDLLMTVWIHEFCHSCTRRDIPEDTSEDFAQTSTVLALKATKKQQALDAMVKLACMQPERYQWFEDGRPFKP